MIPGVPRVASPWRERWSESCWRSPELAANLVPFFTIVGASFGPICGAHGGGLPALRQALGGAARGHQYCWVHRLGSGVRGGDSAVPALSAEMKTYVQPAVLYSFVTGFVVYALLAKAGLQPKVVEMPKVA